MFKPCDVIVIEGSRTDDKYTNLLLEIFHEVGVSYEVYVASCHWHMGDLYESFLRGIDERIVVYIGGMEFAAPGVVSAFFRNLDQHAQLVFSVPTDKAARSATENLPLGTPLITSGLNEINVSHGIKNSALAIAKIVAYGGKANVSLGLKSWFAKNKESKAMQKLITNSKGQIESHHQV